MKKYLFSFILASCAYLLMPSSISAALVTITPQGQVIWQVLGDETSTLKIPPKSKLTVKNISEILTLNTKNGKIVLNDRDVTNVEGDLVEIEARADSNNIKISNVEGQFVIKENGIKVLTAFPITIDPTKNELSVETQSGNRLISILPQEIILTLMRNNLIDSVKENGMMLGESSKGELEYMVKGVKKINLFNVLNIDADVDTNISASNGEILGVIEPQWLKFFGFIFKS